MPVALLVGRAEQDEVLGPACTRPVHDDGDLERAARAVRSCPFLERGEHHLRGRLPGESRTRARALPRRAPSRRSSASRIASASASGSFGSARSAAAPDASSSEGCDDATTGVPHAIASTIGMPNPSMPRRVDVHGRTAVETRQLLVGHVAQPDDAVGRRTVLLAPALAACEDERRLAPEPAPRLDEREEVLARLEGADAQHVRVDRCRSGRPSGSKPGRARDAPPRPAPRRRPAWRSRRLPCTPSSRTGRRTCAPHSRTCACASTPSAACTTPDDAAARGRGSPSRGRRSAAADTSSPRRSARRTRRRGARRQDDRSGSRPSARHETRAAATAAPRRRCRRARPVSASARAGSWARSRPPRGARLRLRPGHPPSRAGSCRSPYAGATAGDSTAILMRRARRQRLRSGRRASRSSVEPAITSAGTAVGETVNRAPARPVLRRLDTDRAARHARPGSRRTDAVRAGGLRGHDLRLGEERRIGVEHCRERARTTAEQPPCDRRPRPVAVRVEARHRRSGRQRAGQAPERRPELVVARHDDAVRRDRAVEERVARLDGGIVGEETTPARSTGNPPSAPRRHAHLVDAHPGSAHR